MKKSKLKFICSSQELNSLDYTVCPIEYRNKKTSAIVFYFEGRLYAYVNHCMHMHRRLDCESDTIFDASGRLLHCSMHGFAFEPSTGECLSPVCAGQKLQALKVVEQDGGIYFNDKHVALTD
ncbi:MAG: Rieske (2Fe-2S) protein [Gammaproteobacteria bacterium]